MTLPKSWEQMKQKQVVAETIEWDGEVTEATITIPVVYKPVLIVVDNQSQSNLAATFDYLIAKGEEEEDPDTWAPLYGLNDTLVSLEITGETCRVYGPFYHFPRLLGGRMTLAVGDEEDAPAIDELTTVYVWEIEG